MSRDHRAAYARRNRLARERGFRSYAQQRRFTRDLKAPTDLGRLPQPARDRRAVALDVLNLARREHLTAEEAAGRLDVPMSAVVWWGAPALEPRRQSRTAVKKADRMLRLHPLIVNGEVTFVTTRGSRAATQARAAFRAQRAYLDNEPGAAQALAKLRGVRVGGELVETDTTVIGEIGRRGDLGDIADNYRALLS
jgi:hypothetical protein